MIVTEEKKEKIEASYKLLQQADISIETFNQIRKLLKGFNPQIDEKLEMAAKALAGYEKFQAGEYVELSAEHLPETTEKEKKRKKALLFFIRSWKQLKGEVERVKNELQNSDGEDKQKSGENQLQGFGKILASAKGPFGLITIAAILIVGAFSLLKSNKSDSIKIPIPTVSPVEKIKIKVITFNDKQIPLAQVYVGTGSDCYSPHYHAIDHTKVTAVDGTIVYDPGGCGFGKVKDTQVIEIQS